MLQKVLSESKFLVVIVHSGVSETVRMPGDRKNLILVYVSVIFFARQTQVHINKSKWPSLHSCTGLSIDASGL